MEELCSYVEDGLINIGTKSTMDFMQNKAGYYPGGAVYMINGALIIKSDASIKFSCNPATVGEAVTLRNATFDGY